MNWAVAMAVMMGVLVVWMVVMLGDVCGPESTMVYTLVDCLGSMWVVCLAGLSVVLRVD